MRIVLTESQYGKLLTEGKLEDLIKKYENDLGDKFYRWYKTQIEEFYEEDPSPTKKYFTWMSKILIDRDIKGLDTDEYNLIEMFKYFDKNIHKFEKKDIYQYTYEELINKYEQAISKVTKKELETSGVEKLYGDEGDRYILVRPKNKEASCKYGANTKWCTTQEHNPDYYLKYSRQGIIIYCINKLTGEKVAAFKSIEHTHENERETSFWDSVDNRIDSMDSNLPNDIMDIIRYEFTNTNKTNWDLLSDDERNKQLLWIENSNSEMKIGRYEPTDEVTVRWTPNEIPFRPALNLNIPRETSDYDLIED